MLLQTPLPAPAGPPSPTPTVSLHADDLVVDLSVYAPQSDSHLLVEAIRGLGDRVAGSRVLDLCCGTGIALSPRPDSGPPRCSRWT